MNGTHLTGEELQLYLDGTLSGEEKSRVEQHLEVCPSCARSAGEMERIGRTVRALPLERTSPGFTASVLHELGLAPSPRRSFRSLESAAALVAMVVVAGMLLTVFFAVGILKQEQVTDTQSAVMGYLEAGGGTVGGWVDALTSAVATYLPFVFGKGAVGISIAALGVLALLAVVDRVAGRRLVHRTTK